MGDMGGMFSAFTILRAYAGDKYFFGASTDFSPCAQIYLAFHTFFRIFAIRDGELFRFA